MHAGMAAYGVSEHEPLRGASALRGHPRPGVPAVHHRHHCDTGALRHLPQTVRSAAGLGAGALSVPHRPSPLHAAGARRGRRGNGRHGPRHRVRNRNRRVLRAVSHELRRGVGRAVAQAIGRSHRHRVPSLYRTVLRFPVLRALRVRAVLRQHGSRGRGVSVLRGFQLANRQEAGQRPAAPSRPRGPRRTSPADPPDLRARLDHARMRRVL